MYPTVKVWVFMVIAMSRPRKLYWPAPAGLPVQNRQYWDHHEHRPESYAGRPNSYRYGGYGSLHLYYFPFLLSGLAVCVNRQEDVYVDLGEIRVQTLLVSKVKYSYCNSIMLLTTFQLTFETSGLIILAKICVFVARIFSFSHMVRP